MKGIAASCLAGMLAIAPALANAAPASSRVPTVLAEAGKSDSSGTKKKKNRRQAKPHAHKPSSTADQEKPAPTK